MSPVQTEQSIELSWNESHDDVGVAGYRVYRNGVLAGAPVITQWNDTGLAPAASYTYRVEAFDAAGNVSPLSASLTVFTQDPPESNDPGIVANGRIFYVQHDGNDNEIYSVNPDGTGTQAVTADTYDSISPALSPDGTKLAYVTNRDGNYEIYVKEVDAPAASPGTRLTYHGGEDNYPAWSPDGNKLVFSRRVGGAQPDIYIMDADGSNVSLFARVGSSSVDDSMPAWSPDGQWIVFRSKAAGNYDIWRKKADGSDNAVNLTAANSAYDGSPVFDSNGDILYQAQSSPSSIMTLWAVPVTGGAPEQVYSGANSKFVAPSPDGTKLVFTRINTVTRKFELVTSNADGSGVTVVAASSSTDILTPVWQSVTVPIGA